MQTLIVSNKSIMDLLDSLTISEETKLSINKIIIAYDTSYIKFIRTLFTVHSILFVPIHKDNHNFTFSEVTELLNRFKLYKKDNNLKYENIYVADKYDFICGNGLSLSETHGKFNHFLYNDIYCIAESVIGTKKTDDIIEEVFTVIEYIVTYLECIMFRLINKLDDSDIGLLQGNIFVYIENTDNELVLSFF